MEPIQKAKELIDKFKAFPISSNSISNNSMSKTAAVICCNVVICELESISDDRVEGNWKYWQKVKENIQAL